MKAANILEIIERFVSYILMKKFLIKILIKSINNKNIARNPAKIVKFSSI